MKRKTMGRRSCRRFCVMTGLAVLLSAGAITPADAAEQTILYGIGSTSKVFTAAAVMKLTEEGKLDLDTPLKDYITEFSMADERYRKITPRMLLDHTSGLPGSTLTNSMLLGDSDTYLHDMLPKLLENQRLKAEPGAFGVYCNDGFTLAEILVERVSGMGFTEYIEKEFAEPLNLSHVKTPQNLGVEAAKIYDPESGKELPAEMANVIGSGGMYSTAEDLVRLSGIFMRDRKNAAGILGAESAEEMEISRYEKAWNPEGYDTNLTYGLGWDSVNTYPFSQYGVKALVKGGDTGFYHGSLTVLPEENISCAVLTSGGSSAVNQLAVQEILMTYLDEIGRIDRDQAKEQAKEQAREQLADFEADLQENAGWYVGTDLFRVSFEEEKDALVLTTIEDGHEKKQSYIRDQSGRLVSEGGTYISGSGEFMRGSNGRIGTTRLDFMERDGRTYLMASIYETYPGLGVTASYLPVGEKLPESERTAEGSQEAGRQIWDNPAIESWKNQDGNSFLLVSEKYTSTAYLTRFHVKPLVSEVPGGYLTFEDHERKPAKITGIGKAEFFQKIPGQAGRDLNDYEIVQNGEKTYLQTAGFRYLLESDISEMTAGSGQVFIGAAGEAEWRSLELENGKSPIIIDTPDNGAWYVYDQTGTEIRCVANSWTMEEGISFILPDKGKIVFAGEPGTLFRYHYMQ